MKTIIQALKYSWPLLLLNLLLFLSQNRVWGAEGPWTITVSTISLGIGGLQNDDGSISSTTDSIHLVRTLYKGHTYRSHVVGTPDFQDEVDESNDFVEALNEAHERRRHESACNKIWKAGSKVPASCEQ